MVKLTTNQVQFYKDYGYLQVSGIFTEQELAEMSQEYDRLFREHKPNMETKQGALISKADNEECSVLTVHNVEFHSRVFGKVLQNENLLDALEGVMSTPDILLHHTKAHSKPARNEAPYLMHQKATPVVAKRGDVVFFSYLTVHGSYSNLSDRVRRMLFIQAFGADDEPIKDTQKSPGRGLVLRSRNDEEETSNIIGLLLVRDKE